MPSTPMNERNIMYFPMQSVQIGTDEGGDPIYDNAADAEILQNLRQREIKDGVYPDVSTYLQVTSNNDMTVTVKAGYAHVQGVQVWVKEDIVLPVTAADPLVDRVDRVVLQVTFVDRGVNVIIKEGSTSLTRIAGQVWELGLADLAIAHNNAVITQAEITDLRLNPSACGVVSGLMQVDTSTIFNQYMEWWAAQQDTTGYLTVPGEYPVLATINKKVLDAINELFIKDYSPHTLYVSTTGNDTTGNGSSATPFATPQKAFDSIKPSWYGDVAIEIASGTYTVTAPQTLSRRLNYNTLLIRRNGSSTVTITSATADVSVIVLTRQTSGSIKISNINVSTTGINGMAIRAEHCINLTLDTVSAQFSGAPASANWLEVRHCPNVHVLNCAIYNCSGIVISAMHASVLSTLGLAGNYNAGFTYSAAGSIIFKGETDTIIGSASIYSNGGLIRTGNG